MQRWRRNIFRELAAQTMSAASRSLAGAAGGGGDDSSAQGARSLQVGGRAAGQLLYDVMSSSLSSRCAVTFVVARARNVANGPIDATCAPSVAREHNDGHVA